MVKLIKSNLRKDKTVLIIFSLIIILATFMMSISTMALKYPALYDEYVEETGTADYIAYDASYSAGDSYDSMIEEYFENADYVESYKDIDTVMLLSLNIRTSKENKEKSSTNWMFQSISEKGIVDTLVFTDRDDSVSGKKIYLNLYTALSNNLGVGDTVYIDSPYGDYEYKVAGIYQDLLMGSTYTYYSALVSDADYEKMQEDRDEAILEGAEAGWNHMLYVDIKEGYDIQKCLKDTKDALSGEMALPSEGAGNDEINELNSAFTNVLSGFMGVFAVLIIVICIIIIVFTISNNINRDVTNIGALKAVGYTVGQIRLAIIVEYSILGTLGAAAGIGISYAIYPVLERMFIRQISGVIWKNRFFPLDSIAILVGVFAVILITVLFVTARIKKLHPATALRFGFQSKALKRNHMPLVSSRGELNLVLAVKSFVQNKAQNLIVTFIMFAVAFVTMFSCVFYYNTQVDISKFQRMIMGDVSDAFFFIKDGSKEATEESIENIKTLKDVTAAYGLGINYAYVGEKQIDIMYATDPSAISFLMYEGRMFSEKNETVLGLSLADSIGAKVGDKVEVSYGNKSMMLTVTGLQQSPMSDRLYVTDEAAEELGINVSYSYIRANVKDADSKKVDAVLKKGEVLGDSNITGTENQFKFQRSRENTPVFAVGFIVLILVVLNVVIVFLVIRLLLKTVFIKREREFGIKKALGFTSFQLRYQLSLSLIPSTLFAAVLGAVIGYVFTNPLFGFVLRGYGLRTSSLIIKPEMMLIPTVAVSVLVFVFSFIMSGRMKRISAYNLMRE